jgi:hypothetical protein
MRRALAGSVTTVTVLPVMSKELNRVAFLSDARSGVALHAPPRLDNSADLGIKWRLNEGRQVELTLPGIVGLSG